MAVALRRAVREMWKTAAAPADEPWSFKVDCLVSETGAHKGLVRLHVHPRSSASEVLFNVQGRVMSRTLCLANGTTFDLKPIEDGARWHWTGEPSELADGNVDRWLGLRKEPTEAQRLALRELAYGLVGPAVLSRMDDLALLNERLEYLQPPLRLGNYHKYREAAHLAAALGRKSLFLRLLEEFEHSEPRQLEPLDAAMRREHLDALRGIATGPN